MVYRRELAFSAHIWLSLTLSECEMSKRNASGTVATAAAAAETNPLPRSSNARPLITPANCATRAESGPRAIANAESAFAIASLNSESFEIGLPNTMLVPEIPLSGMPLQ